MEIKKEVNSDEIKLTDFENLLSNLFESANNLKYLNFAISEKVAKIKDYRTTKPEENNKIKQDDSIIGRLYILNECIKSIMSIASETNDALIKIV